MKKLKIAVLLAAVISFTGVFLACPAPEAEAPPKIPVAGDYDTSVMSPQIAGQLPADFAEIIKIEAKKGKSPGVITRYYEGQSGTEYERKIGQPDKAGVYLVTFDVAKASGWNAAIELVAGTLVINDPEKEDPIPDHFTITGTGNFIFNPATDANNTHAVSVTVKAASAGFTQGTVRNIRYTDTAGVTSPNPPSAIGAYAVTFDVDPWGNWNGATLTAGAVNITDPAMRNPIPEHFPLAAGSSLTVVYDGTPKVVIFNATTGYSFGQRIVTYTNTGITPNTTAPTNVGNYGVRLTVLQDEQNNWNAIYNMNMGNLVISRATLTSTTFTSVVNTPQTEGRSYFTPVNAFSFSNLPAGITTANIKVTLTRDGAANTQGVPSVSITVDANSITPISVPEGTYSVRIAVAQTPNYLAGDWAHTTKLVVQPSLLTDLEPKGSDFNFTPRIQTKGMATQPKVSRVSGPPLTTQQMTTINDNIWYRSDSSILDPNLKTWSEIENTVGVYQVLIDVPAVVGTNMGWKAKRVQVDGIFEIIEKLVPSEDQYVFNGLGEFAYNGSSRAVTMTERLGTLNGASPAIPQISYYKGAAPFDTFAAAETGNTGVSSLPPVNVGIYTAFFRLDPAGQWIGTMNGAGEIFYLRAGVIKIVPGTPTLANFNITASDGAGGSAITGTVGDSACRVTQGLNVRPSMGINLVFRSAAMSTEAGGTTVVGSTVEVRYGYGTSSTNPNALGLGIYPIMIDVTSANANWASTKVTLFVGNLYVVTSPRVFTVKSLKFGTDDNERIIVYKGNEQPTPSYPLIPFDKELYGDTTGIKPKLEVWVNDDLLEEGTHYTIKDNGNNNAITKAGAAASTIAGGMAYVTIQGETDYRTFDFTGLTDTTVYYIIGTKVLPGLTLLWADDHGSMITQGIYGEAWRNTPVTITRNGLASDNVGGSYTYHSWKVNGIAADSSWLTNSGNTLTFTPEGVGLYTVTLVATKTSDGTPKVYSTTITILVKAE